MTMEHIARSFEVSLGIMHPEIDPVEITKIIGLVPKKAICAGSARATPKGDPLPGKYDFTYWTHPFDTKQASELGTVIQEIVERLQDKKPFFHRIVKEGGSVELFCGVFVDGNWDEILSHELMARLASLRVDLRLDVYPRHEADDSLWHERRSDEQE